MDWNNALFSGMSATDSFNSTLFNSKLASRSFWILQLQVKSNRQAKFQYVPASDSQRKKYFSVV